MCNEITLYSTEYWQKCFNPENMSTYFLQSFSWKSGQQNFIAAVVYMTLACVAFYAYYRNNEVK